MIDTYHGVEVADPYRWLEAPDEETRAWVDGQVPRPSTSTSAQQSLKDRLAILWNYERFSAPSKKGDRYFFRHNDGLQNHSVLYTADSLSSAAARSGPQHAERRRHRLCAPDLAVRGRQLARIWLV